MLAPLGLGETSPWRGRHTGAYISYLCFWRWIYIVTHVQANTANSPNLGLRQRGQNALYRLGRFSHLAWAQD
jgi:hypothetical protein